MVSLSGAVTPQYPASTVSFSFIHPNVMTAAFKDKAQVSPAPEMLYDADNLRR
jgi:hypothetical protein